MTDKNTELLREVFDRVFGKQPEAQTVQEIMLREATWLGYQAASLRLAEAMGVIEESKECIVALSRAATERPVKQYKNSMYEALCLADKVSHRAEKFMKGEK